MARYTLRPATDADYDFLYDLHRRTMRESIARIWGWDGAWQAAHFQRHFAPDDYRIVVADGRDAGRVAVVWRAGEVELSNIQILPEYQGRGLGTAIVADLLAGARARGLPVVLQVLKGNPARALYERLGFTITGETATHYRMRAV
jgi:ribosomal protein S18 acetylase RimI-like enzyme